MIRWTRRVATLAPAAALALPRSVAHGAPAAQGSFTRGTVVSLAGTPHIWIADDGGRLHWNGDTRALSSQFVNWNSRVTLPLPQLQGVNRGDPWLSSGLLKDGDPIHLVKWETEWPLPKLYHIQSIRDVELFGINSSNYGAFVIDRGAWEQQFGINVATLERHELPSGGQPPVTPAPSKGLYSADWSSGMGGWTGTKDWKTVGGMLVNDGTVSNESLIWPHSVCRRRTMPSRQRFRV